MKLPSKKIRPLIIACLIAAGSITVATLYPAQNNTKILADQNSNFGTQEKVTIESKLTEIDSDNDGLKDWEESLWGTDPQKKDTDEDGTTDGKEISSNRDPLLKGPKDSLEIKTATSSSASTSKTTTDKLAQDLFAKYMILKQNNQEITPEIGAQLIEGIITNNQYSVQPAKVYLLLNLKLVPDSADALKAYGNAVGKIFKDNAYVENDSKGQSINELLILNDAMEKNSRAELSRMDPIIRSYKNIITQLLNVPVPQGIATPHLELMNNLSLTVTVDEGMQRVFEDTALAISSVNTYKNVADDIVKTFEVMSIYFKSKNVNFTQSEPGFLMTNI